MPTILILAFIQSLFLAALLFSKKNKQISDIVLGVWLLLIGLHMLIHFGYLKLQLQNVILINLNSGFPFLQGPFLYFYVSSLTTQEIQLKRSNFLHFLPYIMFIIYQLFIIKSITESSHEQRIIIHLFDLPSFINIILLLSVPFYIVWSSLLLKKYRIRLLDTYSTIEKINLNWLRYLITGLGVVWLIVIVVFVYMKFLGSSESHNVGHLIFVAITLFVYSIGYFGFRQTTIFSNVNGSIAEQTIIKSQINNEISHTIESVNESFDKYQKSSLRKDQALEILEQLVKYMETEKPYLDDQLTMPLVAAKSGISVNHLSQIINEYRKENFFDFVNSYRVEEVKQKLLNPKNDAFTLLAIAFECGFGSKSAFNRIFKKSTGQTPTQYIKSLNFS